MRGLAQELVLDWAGVEANRCVASASRQQLLFMMGDSENP